MPSSASRGKLGTPMIEGRKKTNSTPLFLECHQEIPIIRSRYRTLPKAAEIWKIRERSSIRSNLCASPRASSVTPQLDGHCITIPFAATRSLHSLKSHKFENETMGEVGQSSSQIHPAELASTNAHSDLWGS